MLIAWAGTFLLIRAFALECIFQGGVYGAAQAK